MTIPLYKHKVILDDSLKRDLLSCLKTHDEIYNFARETTNRHNEISFKQLKDKIKQYIMMRSTEEGDKMLLVPMWNELYYQYKWSRHGLRKSNSQYNIHYLTCLGIGRKTKLLNFVDEMTFTLQRLEGVGTLTEPLTIDENVSAYWNLSYSYLNDEFMLTLYPRSS